MSNDIKVAVSPLSNKIYAGKTIKNGTMLGKGKQDVTIDCLIAVAEHALSFGEPIVISTADGKPEFKITVEKLT